MKKQSVFLRATTLLLKEKLMSPGPVEFTILSEPIPKGSPRTFVNPKTSRAVVYKAPKTRKWENFVRVLAQKYQSPAGLFDCPLRLKVHFYLSRPKSKPKRCLFPDVKPDLKNLVAATEDGLSGVIFTDDKLICDYDTRKRYGDPPRIEIGVYPLTEEDL
jgi:Holliday junction resolvase RusA-like endonuclease